MVGPFVMSPGATAIPNCQFLQCNKRRDTFGHRHAFLSQCLFIKPSLLCQLLLADLKLSFEIGVLKPAAQSPFLQSYTHPSHEGDGLANEMNRTQSRDQDQCGHINSNQQEKRTERTKSVAE